MVTVDQGPKVAAQAPVCTGFRFNGGVHAELRAALERDVSTVPVQSLIERLRNHPPFNTPAGAAYLDGALSQYDHAQPAVKVLGSSSEVQLNANRRIFLGQGGEQSFIGIDNGSLAYSKAVGPQRLPGVQKVFTLCNHGEAAARIKWEFDHGHFNSVLNADEPARSKLRIGHGDGHGDEMWADTAVPWPAERDLSYFELVVFNDRINGISSFLASLVADGVIDPEGWYFKTVMDGWDKRYEYWHRELPAFTGTHDSLMQFGCEVEQGVVTDQRLFDLCPEVTDIDVDYAYFISNPRKLAHAIMLMVKSGYHSPLVTIVASPGWVDERYGALLVKLHAELFNPDRNTGQINEYVDEIYLLLEELCERDIRTPKGKPLYGEVRRDKGGRGDSVAAGRREATIAEMKRIFALPFDSKELELNNTLPDHHFSDTSFYYRFQGSLHEHEAHGRIDARLEFQNNLIPALRTSHFSVVRQVGDAMIPPTTEEALLRRANELPSIPGGLLAPIFETLAPIDYAVAKISHHMRFQLSTSEEGFGADLRLLAGILVGSDLSPRPVTLQHSVLAFLSRLGAQTGFYEFEYSQFERNLTQAHNWRGRLTSLNGVYASPELQARIAGTFTIDDVAAVLEVDGGGFKDIIVTGSDSKYLMVSFSFLNAGQNAPELYAYAILNGKVYLDSHGRPTLEGSPGASGPYQVVDRDVENTRIRFAMREKSSAWQRLPPALDLTSLGPTPVFDMDVFKRLLIDARVAVRSAKVLEKGGEWVESMGQYLQKMEEFRRELHGWSSEKLGDLYGYLRSVDMLRSLDEIPASAQNAVETLLLFFEQEHSQIDQLINRIRRDRLELYHELYATKFGLRGL